MDEIRLRELLGHGETLTIEFKRDRPQPISDREIYEMVVCLANSQGGTLLIGVEDDGTVTGARPRHGASSDSIRLQAAIFNNTEPPINTRVTVHRLAEGEVIAIEVDPYPDICATKAGVCLQRVLGVKGPECRPFYPWQHASRRTALGLLDFSAQVVKEAFWADLDLLAFERLRRLIRRLRGESGLLDLGDQELAQALGLVETWADEMKPTIAGLLMGGREEALRHHLPTHEVAFQVLDAQGNVLVNDFFHGPLAETLDEVERRFAARNQEREVLVGLFRLPIPDYAPEAFREAISNALLHRDYSRLGTAFVQWHPDHLFVTNPGGFPAGITLDNLLVHEPKPRNPRLAEIFLRIGLIEKTGRGIDKIYLGQLRYGRPMPDYSLSDDEGVRVVLMREPTHLPLTVFLDEREQQGSPLSLDELLILNRLLHERHVGIRVASRLLQKDMTRTEAVLARMVESGILKQANGDYRLPLALADRLQVPYARRELGPAVMENQVLAYVAREGKITNAECQRLCDLGPYQASRLLSRLAAEGKLSAIGERRWRYYVLPESH
jgi:ATP-dependent DNA helicase RecG